MTGSDTTRSIVQPNANRDFEPDFVEDQLHRMAESLTRAIDQEVEALRSQGWPIYVCENGKVIDLQQTDSHPTDD
jgi:hypothetical protein